MAQNICTRHELESGYSFARVINGCWQLSAGHGGNRLSTQQLMRRFAELVEAGFTTFDCADIYTGVEALIGKFLGGYSQRERVQVHTKYVPDLETLAALQPADTRHIIDRSLRRLGVEQLDLVQFHWWDYSIPGYLDALESLKGLQESGKIAHIGVTNFDARRLREILDAGFAIETIQAQYSLLDRRVEKGLRSLCREHGVAILAYGVLAGGLLAGYAGQDVQDNRSLVKYRLVVEEAGGPDVLSNILSALNDVAKRHNTTASSVSAAWVLAQPAVSAVILGVGNRPHIDENLALGALQLDDQDRALIELALERATLPAGDVFELERQAGGPHAAKMKMNLNRSG